MGDHPLLLLQFPTSGSFTFQLAPYNTTIGSAGVIVDSTQGVAAATIVKDPKEDGIYGIPPPGQYIGARPLLPACPVLQTRTTACMCELLGCNPAASVASVQEV